MISAPRAQPFYPAELPLAELTASRAELEQHFGPPHRLSDAQDNEPGPCAYWAYQFPCGQVAFITFHISKDAAALYADAPELDHLVRHLELPEHLRERLQKCEIRLPGRQPTTPLAWNLWRQDLHGNRFLVGSHPTLRAADCTRVNLEAGGHKQVYWVEQETIGRKDFKLCPQCLRDYQLLSYKPEARYGLSFVPFSCIVWRDEHPREGRLCYGHPDCAMSILKLSAARLGLWKAGAIPDEYAGLWEEARETIPNWPGFKRLTISSDERESQEALEREQNGVTDWFTGEGWKVEDHVDEHGLRSFKAKKTWRAKLREKLGFSTFQSPQTRVLRRIIGLAFVAWIGLAIAGGIGIARLAPSRKWPVQSGEVLEVRPGPWLITHRRADVCIRLHDGSEVHATVAPGTVRQLPRDVRFHYSGDPSREVFLHEIEGNPDWMLYVGVPMIAFLAWCLFFADLEKATRQLAGARGPVK